MVFNGLANLCISNLITESCAISIERPQYGANIGCGKEHGREPACSGESGLDAMVRGANPITRENGAALPSYDSYMVRGDGCPGAHSRMRVFQPR